MISLRMNFTNEIHIDNDLTQQIVIKFGLHFLPIKKVVQGKPRMKKVVNFSDAKKGKFDISRLRERGKPLEA